MTGVAVAPRHKTNAGGIGVALSNIVALGETLMQTISLWTSIGISLGAIGRIEAFEEDTTLEPEIPPRQQSGVPAEWPSSGELKLYAFSARFHPNVETPLWSLQDTSLQINSGQRVTVCERTGSGKSTSITYFPCSRRNNHRCDISRWY